jgi:hypothetical protein
VIYIGLLLFFVLEYIRPTSYVPGLMVLRLNSATRHVVRVRSETGHATVPVSTATLTIHPSLRRPAPALAGIRRMPR